MSDFLPASYEAPVSGNYVKLLTGKNKLRLLSKPIFGYVYWVTTKDGRRPVRKRMDEKIDHAALEMNDDGEREKARHFWAMTCWNYAAKAVQIIEITQATIRDGIMSLDSDEDWGNPTGYDITIVKIVKGEKTSYSLTPSNKGPIPAEIQKEFLAINPNLEALFSGGDPFASTAPLAAEAGQRRAPADDLWRVEKALEELAKVGVDSARLKERWAELGRKGWNAERDTITVRDWIGELSLTTKQTGDHKPIDDSEIPF